MHLYQVKATEYHNKPYAQKFYSNLVEKMIGKCFLTVPGFNLTIVVSNPWLQLGMRTISSVA